jgi:hypothetical protein
MIWIHISRPDTTNLLQQINAVDELKTTIHEVIAEDIEAWRETFNVNNQV